MKKLVCSQCKRVSETGQAACPHCGASHPFTYDFSQSDRYLQQETRRVIEERRHLGLEGLVGGLDCVIVNTEPEHQVAAVEELLATTGLDISQAFQDDEYVTYVLATPGSADVLVRSRRQPRNPFWAFNDFPQSRRLPNTRLETLVFATPDLETYVSIQRSRGVHFLTPSLVRTDYYDFIQTPPSPFTGNSLGFIEWKEERSYASHGAQPVDRRPSKPDRDHLDNIGALDHAATRVRAEDRDAAIIEFMGLTNYHFDFAIYVQVFNSITNVARLTAGDYAMVFTSGISSYVNDEVSGPTEKFIHNYGPRVHHLAFRTRHIQDTYASLRDQGMQFLIPLVGSPHEGLRQTFTHPSSHTLLVTEYIHRYGDFDGFFTRSNVTKLTGATTRQ